MSEFKKQVDINIIIRLDDHLKEQLLSSNITVDENVKIITSLRGSACLHLPSIHRHRDAANR